MNSAMCGRIDKVQMHLCFSPKHVNARSHRHTFVLSHNICTCNQTHKHMFTYTLKYAHTMHRLLNHPRTKEGKSHLARAVPHTGSDVCNVRTLRCALRLKKLQRTIHHRDCPSRPLAASGTWPHNHHL